VFEGGRGPYEVGVWKYIRAGSAGLTHYVRYEVVNDSKVLFWHDV
jgi:hypothetical protein